jgi:hypothetical protein
MKDLLPTVVSFVSFCFWFLFRFVSSVSSRTRPHFGRREGSASYCFFFLFPGLLLLFELMADLSKRIIHTQHTKSIPAAANF